MVDAVMITLRDIPAFAAIERLERGQGEWLTDAEITERAEQVSLKYFGVTTDDTWGPMTLGRPVRPDQHARQIQRPDDWDDAFEILKFPEENDYLGYTPAELLNYLEEHGIDAGDENGTALRCLRRFARQLICVADRMMPEAVFSPDGAGGAAVSAERWGAALEEEAKRFKRGGR